MTNPGKKCSKLPIDTDQNELLEFRSNSITIALEVYANANGRHWEITVGLTDDSKMGRYFITAYKGQFLDHPIALGDNRDECKYYITTLCPGDFEELLEPEQPIETLPIEAYVPPTPEEMEKAKHPFSDWYNQPDEAWLELQRRKKELEEG